MALPTAQTPGYTTYSGKVSCVCLAAWLPWLEKLSLAHGYIKYRLDVLQLTGNYSLSGGTHYGGGVFDIKQYDTRIAMLAREMGAPATWLRNMLYADGSPGNTHTHGVLTGCPHLSSGARWQITEQKAGRDGFASPHPDPLPDPKVYRTWQQGITWAKSELVRITGQNIIDNLETVMALSDTDKAWLTAQFAKVASWTYKNTDTTRDAYDYLRNPGLDVWDENYVTRDGEKVSMKQEVADIKTQAVATAGAVAALTAKVDTLKDGVANLVTLIQESHPKADPEPAPAPVPALGVDVSRHQTAEQVTAAVAGEGYEFVIINATTGLRSSSSALGTNTDIARASGDLTGFYHWSQTINDLATTPDKSDPIGEATHFLATAPYRAGDLLTLDHEQPLGTWEQRVAYALAWLEEVRFRTGAKPPIYLNWDWIKGLRAAATLEQWERLTDFDVWLADPSGIPGKHEPIDPKPGSAKGWRVAIHQWSTADNLDRNWTPDLGYLRTLTVPQP